MTTAHTLTHPVPPTPTRLQNAPHHPSVKNKYVFHGREVAQIAHLYPDKLWGPSECPQSRQCIGASLLKEIGAGAKGFTKVLIFLLYFCTCARAGERVCVCVFVCVHAQTCIHSF